jgi:hypothetical protein
MAQVRTTRNARGASGIPGCPVQPRISETPGCGIPDGLLGNDGRSIDLLRGLLRGALAPAEVHRHKTQDGDRNGGDGSGNLTEEAQIRLGIHRGRKGRSYGTHL